MRPVNLDFRPITENTPESYPLNVIKHEHHLENFRLLPKGMSFFSSLFIRRKSNLIKSNLIGAVPTGTPNSGKD